MVKSLGQQDVNLESWRFSCHPGLGTQGKRHCGKRGKVFHSCGARGFCLWDTAQAVPQLGRAHFIPASPHHYQGAPSLCLPQKKASTLS